VDTEAFRTQLPDLYGGSFDVDHPLDRSLRPLMDDVEGMATENGLALLQLAARLLPDDEAYLEVGSFKGLSLTAAMMANSRSPFYAIENFLEFGADPEKSRAEIMGNLDRWADRRTLTFLEGDAFQLMDRKWIKEPIGVYYFDGIHGRFSQYLAFGVAEPLLADEALVIIDDASWPVVANASDRYVAAHPGYELLFDIRASGNFDPRWFNGTRVYRFRRPPGSQRSTGFDVRWRRWGYFGIEKYGMTKLGDFLRGHPRLDTWLKRVLPISSWRVGDK
jgi:predicted O-methyltransferase YrrM